MQQAPRPRGPRPGGRLRALVFLCLLAGGEIPRVFSGGKAETPEPEPRNKEWVLCVTAFDVSALPPGQRLTGEVLARDLFNSLSPVKHRFRAEEEYAYYQNYAWTQGRSDAAKQLAAKRAERDQLLFRGDPGWKYRNSLKTVEAEIKKLEESYAKAEEERPLVAPLPLFKLAEGNSGGVFPPPPQGGGEYRFCVNQRADAFLTGRVSPFHGRLYMSLRMYAVHTRSFLYEDGIIFSTGDTAAALNELAGRLVAAAAGAEPAFIAVRAGPEEATVTINGAFAGRGDIVPREHPPGEVTVEVFADGYETVSLPAVLREGEVAELFINLKPLSRQALTIEVPAKPGTLVYRGALYLGDAPFTLTMPAQGYEYLRVETPEGETGALVVRGTGRSLDNPPVFEVRTKMPKGEDEKPVGTARRRFYGAYGRFWIALPVAFILGGVYNAYLDAYKNNITQAMYDETMKYWYISTGATVVAGLALTETFYRIFRYVRASGEDTTPPIVR